MRRYRPFRPAVLCLALSLATAGVTLLSGATPAYAALAWAQATRPRVAGAGLPAATTAGSPQTIFLAGGDRVSVPAGEGGAGTVYPAPASGGLGASAVSFTAGGRDYVVPDAMLPCLSRGLNLSLFDVRAVARAEHGGRLPLRIRFRGRPDWPGQGVALTGLTTTSRPAAPAYRTATGYLTVATAARFGAVLGCAARHRSLPGGETVTLAGAPATAAAPAGARDTLTVTGTNLAGQPDSGDQVFVYNIDNSNRYDGR